MAKVAKPESIVDQMRSRLFVAVLRDDKETPAAERIRAYVAVQFKTSRSDYAKSGAFVVRKLTELGWDDGRIAAASLTDIDARVVPLEFEVLEEPPDPALVEAKAKSSGLFGFHWALESLAGCMERECRDGPTKYIPTTAIAGDPDCPAECSEVIIAELAPAGPFPATLNNLERCFGLLEEIKQWCPELAVDASGMLCEVKGVTGTKAKRLSKHTRDEVARLAPLLRTLSARVELEKRATDAAIDQSDDAIRHADKTEPVSPSSEALSTTPSKITAADDREVTFSPAGLANELDLATTRTLNEWMTEAGLPTPGKGGKSFQYRLSDALTMCDFKLRSGDAASIKCCSSFIDKWRPK